jgi:hypothetical protein
LPSEDVNEENDRFGLGVEFVFGLGDIGWDTACFGVRLGREGMRKWERSIPMVVSRPLGVPSCNFPERQHDETPTPVDILNVVIRDLAVYLRPGSKDCCKDQLKLQ